jgi:hypothetical protein
MKTLYEFEEQQKELIAACEREAKAKLEGKNVFMDTFAHRFEDIVEEIQRDARREGVRDCIRDIHMCKSVQSNPDIIYTYELIIARLIKLL